MHEHQVSIWNSVPALMQLLTGSGARLPNSLRLVLLSGDWIPLRLPDEIRAAGASARIVSLGGATEASIWSIYFPIDQVEAGIPYGKPLANQRFHVLNDVLRPCPKWTPGDLYIAGLGLATGYWHDDDRTRASFITHPHTGERLYRTGDRGRYVEDGVIEFLGRQDLQVKVNGHRIELGEIEAALQQHPAVDDVVVAAVGEPRGSRQLIAYVVSRNPPTRAELRDFLSRTLPAYMLPGLYVNLDALPLTGRAKSTARRCRSPMPFPRIAPMSRRSSSAQSRRVCWKSGVLSSRGALGCVTTSLISAAIPWRPCRSCPA